MYKGSLYKSKERRPTGRGVRSYALRTEQSNIKSQRHPSFGITFLAQLFLAIERKEGWESFKCL